jgi:hypothetical protein
VHAVSSDEVASAKRCLEQTGAKDISTTGEVQGESRAAARHGRDATFSETLRLFIARSEIKYPGGPQVHLGAAFKGSGT